MAILISSNQSLPAVHFDLIRRLKFKAEKGTDPRGSMSTNHHSPRATTFRVHLVFRRLSSPPPSTIQIRVPIFSLERSKSVPYLFRALETLTLALAFPAMATTATDHPADVKPKKRKEPKAKKPAAPKKASPSHPTYLEMIGEAISSLKERTGSSQHAIAKFMEDKHKSQLPSNFKKLLLVQLKKLTAGGKLTKIKNSYKLPSTMKKAASAPTAKPKPAAAPSKPKAKPALASKPKAKAAAKPKAKTASAKAKSPAKVAKSPAKVAKSKVRPAKAAKTTAKASPAKKAAKAKPVVAPKKKAASPAKPKVKSVKKVGKSPAKSPAAKKAPVPKKAKK